VAPGRPAGRVAILCSAHGFGHVARQLAVGEALRLRGVEPRFYTAAPVPVLDEYLPGADVRSWTVDVGIAQRDSLHEDPARTAELLEERASDAAIDRLAEALREDGVRVALVDVAPPALEACRRAGIPAFAVGNFDWAWIYGHYEPLSAWATRFRDWQAPHPALALTPGPGMTGFASVEPVGMIGRRRPPDASWRASLPPGTRAVLVSFGGFGLDGVRSMLPQLPGVRWVLAPPMAPLDRDDALYVTGVPYPSLVATVDAVLTKPGYGIYTEAALAGTPLIWLDRGAFPEAPWLEDAMRARGDVKVGTGDRQDLPARIAEALTLRWATSAPLPVDADGVDRIVDRVWACLTA